MFAINRENVDNIIQFTSSNSLFSFLAMNSFDENDEQIYENCVLYWNTLGHKDITFKKLLLDI